MSTNKRNQHRLRHSVVAIALAALLAGLTGCGDNPDAPSPAEVCTDGVDNDEDGATDCTDTDCDCSGGQCGDGVVDPSEQCDDGTETASCNFNCTFASCGDGFVNPAAGEDCDDTSESAACNANCTFTSCGDGVMNGSAGEGCDDGGESATCNANCTLAGCGDGMLNATAGEECDDAGESATCNANCTVATCGDGEINAAAGEECDDAGESAVCDASCTLSACGDGEVNTSAGEECDDGGATAACTIDCLLQVETESSGPGLAMVIPLGAYDGSLASMACVPLTTTSDITVSEVELELAMSHTWVGDITIKIQSPAGTVTTVMSRPGVAETADDGNTAAGEGHDSDLDAGSPITFRNGGATDADSMASLLDGVGIVCQDDGLCEYAPNPGTGPGTDLSDFAGESAAGEWNVCVGDSVTFDAGTIDAVTLTFIP